MKLKPITVISSSVKRNISINSDIIMTPRASSFEPKSFNNHAILPGSIFNDVTTSSPLNGASQFSKLTLNPLAKAFIPNPLLEVNTESSLHSSLNNLNDCSLNNTNKHNSCEEDEMNSLDILKDIRIKNVNRLIIGQLNINL